MSVPNRDRYGTGEAGDQALKKDRLFPGEGGPAVLEVAVPAPIIDRLAEDFIADALMRGGEARFVPGYGLEELLAAWPALDKRLITPADPDWPAVTRWATSR